MEYEVIPIAIGCTDRLGLATPICDGMRRPLVGKSVHQQRVTTSC